MSLDAWVRDLAGQAGDRKASHLGRTHDLVGPLATATMGPQE
jgi:hypothetical protein